MSIMNMNKKYNILIIDDDKTERSLLKAYLDNQGYSFSEAENGKKGFELFLSYDFDLILLDYMMPVMDGIECLEKIKSVDNKKKIPVIFLTGYDNQKSHEKIIELGADDILLKPYEEYLLMIKIQSWLRIKEKMDSIASKQEELYENELQHYEDLTISNQIIKKRTAFDSTRIKNIKLYEQPAEIMSGDIFLTEISPSGKQNILLGDFTGHGLPAAIGSMMVSDIFYSMISKGFSIFEVANEINKKLKFILPINRFMAGCLIEINYEENNLSIIQAGLPDVILYNSKSNEIETVSSEFVPLGIQSREKNNFRVKNIKIDEFTKIFIYSDGLIESKNNQGEIFGKDNLINTIKKSYDGFTAYEKIINTFRKFMGEKESFDDVTLVEIQSDPNLIEKKSENYTNILKRTSSEWSLNISIDYNVMKEIDPIPSIINQLIELQGIQISRSKLYIILTELYSNALEHGILDLDSKIKENENGFIKYYELRDERLKKLESGKIDFIFKHIPKGDGGILAIQVKNSGDGFDFSEINYYLETNSDYKGRGIGLINSLSDSFYYSENGCSANVEIGWKEAA